MSLFFCGILFVEVAYHQTSCAVDWDLVFADDEREANPTSFKFLQMAQAWASVKKTGGAGGSTMLSGLVAQAAKFKKADAPMSDVASSEDGEDD